MCRYLKIVSFLSLLIFFTVDAKRLLLIETSNDPFYNYTVLESLCENAGFETSIAHFYDVPDLENFDAVFLLMDEYFFAYMDKNKWLKNVIKELKSYAKKDQEKLIGLIFPANTRDDKKFFTKATNFLAEFSVYPSGFSHKLAHYLPNYYKSSAEQRVLLDDYIHMLLQPSHIHASWYNTALLYKDQDHGEKPLLPELKPLERDNKKVIYTVPSGESFLENKFALPAIADRRRLGPIGLVVKQAHKKFTTTFFIAKMSSLCFSEVNENFKTNPVEQDIRQQFFATVQATLQELHTVLSNNNKEIQEISLPISLQPQYSLHQKELMQAQRKKEMRPLYNWTNDGIFVAFHEIEPYVTSEEQLKKGVNSLLDTQFNALWITFNPERFLSPLVKNKIRDTFKFFSDVEMFTAGLKKNAQEKNVPIPHVFISFDITTNFKTEPVVNSVVDLFGTKLDKVPAPLDWEHCWEPEFLQPFNAFVDYWEHFCGNGVPIAGIFMDLEMYHAQNQAGQYTNTMDFGDHSWNIYDKKCAHEAHKNLKTPQERIDFLLKTKRLEKYLSCLKEEAFELGKKLREEIRKKLPNAMIGIYTITLPESWFLLGFLAGLSTPEDPLLLLTFNNEAFSHFEYLRSNKIYCFHLPIVLLSKLRTPEDFSLITRLNSYHDGIWFNRVSRLVEKLEPTSWWELETSPLPIEEVIVGIQKELKA